MKKEIKTRGNNGTGCIIFTKEELKTELEANIGDIIEIQKYKIHKKWYPTYTQEWQQLYAEYLKEVDKIELIEYELSDILIAIIETTNIGTYSIPDSIINTMQKQIKKPEYKEDEEDDGYTPLHITEENNE